MYVSVPISPPAMWRAFSLFGAVRGERLCTSVPSGASRTWTACGRCRARGRRHAGGRRRRSGCSCGDAPSRWPLTAASWVPRRRGPYQCYSRGGAWRRSGVVVWNSRSCPDWRRSCGTRPSIRPPARGNGAEAMLRNTPSHQTYYRFVILILRKKQDQQSTALKAAKSFTLIFPFLKNPFKVCRTRTIIRNITEKRYKV